MNPAREILRRSPIIQTSDPAEMRHVLFTAYGAKSFDFSTKEKFEAGVDFVQLEDIGIGICRYGTATTVGFSESDSVRLQIALNGRAETTIGGKRYAIDGPTGCVIPSGRPLQASFSKHYEQLLVRIKTDALERNLTAILGAKPKDRLEFSPAIDLSSAYGQSLHKIIWFLSQQMNSTATRLAPLTLQHLQNAIISAFLMPPDMDSAPGWITTILLMLHLNIFGAQRNTSKLTGRKASALKS